MTDLDRAAVRREITDALETALERRHEVLDTIVESADRAEAVTAVAQLLGKSQLGAQAVLGMSLAQLTKDERRQNAVELEDLNHRLTFTLNERPASTAESLVLRDFSADTDADIFAARTEELGVAGDGSGTPATPLDAELRSAVERLRAEEAAWLVALDGGTKVGLVFGELHDGEVDVRVWVHPDHRKQGYATAALRKSRGELAANFPGVPLVVRAPGL
ncbi:GNAT family N-acetyltransferase [Williamsia sterculiae]|uniref:Acetyltransferase (GNAT) domain-containing protein n=1 Tax=Williamsia sterculiae TaxID=1344003 RepID=A0A1N7CS35_9NOCA|nr:GNAT family N-acetyltransferase [Williamsia sterculiae]SIR66393.1 Acetyltransferase (GNAT) domain-containing protein [Williamsia sterculiae]